MTRKTPPLKNHKYKENFKAQENAEYEMFGGQ